MDEKESLIGTTLGHYEILSLLGEGGMGAVYLAEHPEIKSRVAIKVLKPHLLHDEEATRRFLDEARAVNRVGHAGVVRIHDAGVVEGVGAYLVMELLEGETLSQRLRRDKTLPPTMVARLLRQAASALCACHAANLVHRDLKPANLFVVPDPDVVGGERIKVLDFGIAKLLEGNDETGGGTKTGAIIGSPLYMSPEQCVDSKDLDARADVYAMGAMGYVMLTGVPPYRAKTLGQLVLAHYREHPRSPHQLRPEVPETLSRAFMEALAVDREARTPTMAVLRDQLVATLGERTDAQIPMATPGRGDPPGAPRPHDLAINPTTLSGATGQSRANDLSTDTPGRRRGRLAWVLLPVVVLALGGLLWVRGGTAPDQDKRAPVTRGVGSAARPADSPTPENAPPRGGGAVVSVPPASPLDASPAPSPDARLATVTLKISPAGATVTLDGKPVEGNEVRVPAGGPPRTLRVKAPGHLTQERPLAADADRTVTITLKRKPTHKPRRRHARPTAPYYNDL